MKFLTLFLLCCVAAKDINGAITIGQYTKDIKTRMDSKMAELQSKVSAASGGSKTVKVPTAPKLPTPANPNQEIEKPPKIPLPNPKCDLKGLLALLKALFGKVEGSCSSVEKGCGPIKQQCSKAKSNITMEFSVMFTVTEQVSYEFPTCSEVVDPTIKGLTSAIGKLFDALGAAISPGTPDGGSASNGTDTSSGGSATNGTDTSSGGSASGGSASGGSATNGTDTSSGGSATNGTDTSSGGSATNGTSTEISESNAECGKNVDISIKTLVMALQKMFLSMNSVTASAQPAPNSNAADAVSASDAFLNYVLQIIKSLLSMVTSVNSTSDLGCSDVAQNLSDTIDATLNKTSGGGKILGSVCVQFSASLTMIYKSVSAVNLEATTSKCDKAKTDIASDLGSEAIANGTAADVVNKASKSVADFFGTIGQTCADLKTDAPAMGGKVDSVLTKVSTSISNIFALLLISANESATNGTSTTGSAGNGTDSSTGAGTSTDESATDGTSTSTTGSATNGTDSSTGESATNGTSTSTGGSANNGTSSASASQFSIKVDAAVCSLIQYLVNLWSVLTTVIDSLSSDESVAATTATSALESIGKAIAFVCFQVISSLSAIFEKLNQTCSPTLDATVTAIGEIDLESDFGTIGEDLTKLLESSSGSPANGTDASSSGSGTSGNSTATDGGTSSANNGTSSSTAASAR